VSDRKGAFKISLIVFGLVSFNWLLGVNHVPSFFPELDRFSHALRMGLYAGAATWLFYLALEPIVRRNLSDLIVSWNRLLAGDWRDPLVGRDVLIGALAGVGHMILIFLGKLLERVVNGDFRVIPNPVNEALSGSRYLFAELLGGAVFGIVGGFGVVCALGLLYLLLRRRALVALIIFVLISTIEFLFFTHSLVYLPITLSIAALWTFLITRMGLVATVVHLIVFAWLQNTLFTLNLSAWYASGMFVTTTLIVGLLVYGFRISTSGRPLFDPPRN
jgi:serine/threonine-protein kinase